MNAPQQDLPFGAAPADMVSSLVPDVLRAGVYDQASAVIPGSRWCDPTAVATLASGLPTDRDVVVYRVYGHEVSRSTAMRLRAGGLKARNLERGIDAWRTAGRPLVDKPSGDAA